MTTKNNHNQANSFQAYSIKYENISNRIQRLKLNQTPNNAIVSRSSSLGNSQAKPLIKNYSSHRIGQTTNILSTNDESSLDIGSKYAGRVTKNTGIKKYNQRQIRQIIQNRKYSPQKLYQEQVNLFHQNGKSLKILQKASQERERERTRDNNMNFYADTNNESYSQIQTQTQVQAQTFDNQKYTNTKLVPGKIYTREQLERYYVCI